MKPDNAFDAYNRLVSAVVAKYNALDGGNRAGKFSVTCSDLCEAMRRQIFPLINDQGSEFEVRGKAGTTQL